MATRSWANLVPGAVYCLFGTQFYVMENIGTESMPHTSVIGSKTNRGYVDLRRVLNVKGDLSTEIYRSVINGSTVTRLTFFAPDLFVAKEIWAADGAELRERGWTARIGYPKVSKTKGPGRTIFSEEDVRNWYEIRLCQELNKNRRLRQELLKYTDTLPAGTESSVQDVETWVQEVQSLRASEPISYSW